MKVLHISLSNTSGGAAKLVRSLNNRLNTLGVSSTLLVFEGLEEKNTILINSSRIDKLVFKIKNKISNLILLFFFNKSKDIRSINLFGTSRVINFINIYNPDIVHVHWIGAEMLSIKNIAMINKKIIWTLHDSWILNGSYHINPNDYLQDVSKNAYLIPDNTNILEKYLLQRKKKYLHNKNITFTVPSSWFLDKFNNSFFNNKINDCFQIPNFIDRSEWFPESEEFSRKLYNINTTKKIIIFGANNVTTSFNKGFSYIKYLIDTLPANEFIFLIFGENKYDFNKLNGCEVINFGKISNPRKLRLLLSVGNVTIVPSLSESFSMVSLESITCGTPVLAFNNTGIASIVKHKINGYLANKFDKNSLKEGLEWLIENKLSKIETTSYLFDEKIVVNSFLGLYKKYY